MKRMFRNLFAIVSFAILALVGNLQADTVMATVASVTGTAQYALPQSLSFNPLKTGQQLPVGSSIRTGDDGKVVLVTTPGSAIELGNNSILKINELAFQKAGGAVTERKARLELTSGVVSALVDPSTPKVTDFKIQTPDGALVARGTHYTVIVRDGKTYSSVGEGKISAIASPSRGSI
jgi:hypothetical protein